MNEKFAKINKQFLFTRLIHKLRNNLIEDIKS